MSDDPKEPHDDQPFGSDIPELEDASEPQVRDEVVDDDETDPEPDVVARSTDGDVSKAEEQAIERAITGEEASPEEDDGLSDVARISDPPVTTASSPRIRRVGDWEYETSAHHVVVELKRIENEVRSLLEGVDSRRKRRLGGTQRWHELSDDILAWRFSGRVPEESLRRLQQLIARRHFLYHHLQFVAATRPVMNS